MSQSSVGYDVTRAEALGGGAFRNGVNEVLLAIATRNSGATAPTDTYPNLEWVDTSNASTYYLKIRNHDDTDWQVLAEYNTASKVWTESTLLANTINSATSKATPVDADELGLVDSAASNVLKKLTWANLKATLKTYFDGLYPAKVATTTDNAIARYDGTTGQLQNSGVTIDDNNNLTIGGATQSGTKDFRASSGTLASGESVKIVAEGGIAGVLNRTARIVVYKHAGIANPAGALGLSTQDGVDQFFWFDDNDQPRMSTNANHAGTTSGSALAKDYEEATATLTATGMTTSPTATAQFTRVGKNVSFYLSATITGTSNSSAFTLTGIPTNMRPANSRYILVTIQDNGGSFTLARGVISSTGVITLYKDFSGTGFISTGTKSIAPLEITYQLY